MVKSQADSLAARAKLNEALAMYRALEPRLADQALLEQINRMGGNAAQLEESRNQLRLLVKSGQGLCLNGISQTHYNLLEAQEGVEFLKLAVAAYREVLADEKLRAGKLRESWLSVKAVEASALGDLAGRLDNSLGKRDEAFKYLDEALNRYRELYQATGDVEYKHEEAFTLNRIGVMYAREAKDAPRALEFYQRSLDIYRAHPGRERMAAQVLVSIALRQFLNFDYQPAFDNLERARAIYRELDDKAGQATVLQSLTTMHWLLNDKRKVAEYVKQTLEILQSADYAANWKKNLSIKGMGVFDENFSGLIESSRLHGIALAYRMNEDYAMSLEYYEQAMVVTRANKNPGLIRTGATSLGYTYAKLEKWDKAAEHYRQALEISRQQGVREEIAGDLQDLGWALLELGKFKEALEHQNEALTIYKSVGVDENHTFAPLFSALLNELSRTHHALGNRRLAILYGKRGVNAIQAERQKFQNLDPLAQKGFLEKKEKHYRRLANWLIEEGRLLEAEQVLQMLKEEEVLSYLRRDASEADKLRQRADLRPEESDALTRYEAIADKLAALGAEFGKLQELQKQGLNADQQKRFDELAKQTQDANKVFGAFLRQLADEFAARPNVKTDLQENLALKSDLKTWGEGVVFLYTLVGEDRYRVILTTSRAQADGKTEINAATLNDKISKFRDAVQNPAIDPRPLGKELYDILIKPVERQLDGAGAKTLLWSLDGNLRLLPFAALWDGRQYFGQKYQNVTITLATRTRLGTPVAPGWQVLGLGVTQSKTVREPNGTRDIPFGALPAVKTELASIVKNENSPGGVLPGRILLDADFNEAQLKKELVKGYKVIHIASHFSLHAGDATNSFLLLGDGTALTVSEMKTNDQITFDEVELLTLSACQTAMIEKDGTGKEVEGFGYVAQRKGAKAILATLWSVADESTQLLMSEFYRLRKTDPKLTKAAALQLAQQAMLEGKLSHSPTATPPTRGLTPKPEAGTKSSQYAHPYYWSPFVLIGNWR
jgi:CHAT domain-containing protein/tetratricopeptide (TPR) repeat protein